MVVADMYYFLTNTGWNAYDGKGRKKEGLPPVASAVYKLKLGRAAVQ